MSRFRSVLASAFAFCALLDLSMGIALAQGAPAEPGSTPAAAETLHAGTELVIVDVVVQDRSGNPLKGLTRDNFALTEQKKGQTLRVFEEHSAAAVTATAPPIPPQPPGTYIDYTPVAPDSALNILLIDTLNTPEKDQAYVRLQLLDYLKHEKAGTRVAVFGLSTRLYMLQGFTADPAILRAAVEYAMLARASPLLKNPTGGSEPLDLVESMRDSGLADTNPEFAEILAQLEQIDAERHSFEIDLRTKYTLDAFDGLAHYLSNLPGRKNLIWFSGSFPLSVLPDSNIQNPFAVIENDSVEFRETTSLLAKAQVAVYPIDARGLMTNPLFDASNKGRSSYARHPASFANDVMDFERSQTDEHSTMQQMADDTGGQAFYNTNGLSEAIAKALDAGSHYYTLAYTPTNHNWNGKYRDIRVKLVGVSAASDLHLSYRRGYYADDPDHRAKHDQPPVKAASTAAAAVDDGSAAYSHAAISHGAPAPQDILFKVRVMPLTGKDEETVAPDNRADPEGRMKAPYRTYAIDYVALPSAIKLAPQPNGRHKGAVEFTAFVFDADGNRLNVSDKEVSLDLRPDTYKEFLANPIRFQLQVSAPVKQDSYLRIVMRDVPNNRYGVVEIPTAEVRRLPPLEARATPADAKRPAAAAGAQPATKQ